MNKIAESKCEDILSLFKSNTADLPDCCAVRAEEKGDSDVFKFLRKLSVRGMKDNWYYRIYENSFSRARSRFDECGRVNLTSSTNRDYDKHKKS